MATWVFTEITAPNGLAKSVCSPPFYLEDTAYLNPPEQEGWVEKERLPSELCPDPFGDEY